MNFENMNADFLMSLCMARNVRKAVLDCFIFNYKTFENKKIKCSSVKNCSTFFHNIIWCLSHPHGTILFAIWFLQIWNFVVLLKFWMILKILKFWWMKFEHDFDKNVFCPRYVLNTIFNFVTSNRFEWIRFAHKSLIINQFVHTKYIFLSILFFHQKKWEELYNNPTDDNTKLWHGNWQLDIDTTKNFFVS